MYMTTDNLIMDNDREVILTGDAVIATPDFLNRSEIITGIVAGFEKGKISIKSSNGELVLVHPEFVRISSGSF